MTCVCFCLLLFFFFFWGGGRGEWVVLLCQMNKRERPLFSVTRLTAKVEGDKTDV
jgi:hypothetical protein